MTEVFVDTYFWVAALNPNDPYHQKVIQTPKPPRAVTTWAVQLEVMNALCAQLLRPLGVLFWQLTSKDPDLVIVPLDEQLLQ